MAHATHCLIIITYGSRRHGHTAYEYSKSPKFTCIKTRVGAGSEHVLWFAVCDVGRRRVGRYLRRRGTGAVVVTRVARRWVGTTGRWRVMVVGAHAQRLVVMVMMMTRAATARCGGDVRGGGAVGVRLGFDDVMISLAPSADPAVDVEEMRAVIGCRVNDG